MKVTRTVPQPLVLLCLYSTAATAARSFLRVSNSELQSEQCPSRAAVHSQWSIRGQESCAIMNLIFFASQECLIQHFSSCFCKKRSHSRALLMWHSKPSQLSSLAVGNRSCRVERGQKCLTEPQFYQRLDVSLQDICKFNYDLKSQADLF